MRAVGWPLVLLHGAVAAAGAHGGNGGLGEWGGLQRASRPLHKPTWCRRGRTVSQEREEEHTTQPPRRERG